MINSMSTQPVLQTTGLTRSFGNFVALAPTDLAIQPGEIIAVMGPNGAGKSTLLACLAGLLRPTSGRIAVAGHDLYRSEREAKRAMAYVPDVPHFYTELT